MNYKELMEKSRDVMGTKLCKSCPVCDGKACRNTVPGPGAKGIGDVAMRNYDAWKNIRVICDICGSVFLIYLSSILLFVRIQVLRRCQS